MTGIVPESSQPDRGRLGVLLATLLAAAWLCVAPGCDTVQGTGKVDGGWPWRPMDMQVHELTRITRPDAEGNRFVEVRVAFIDRDRDSTKAHDTLAIEITRIGEGDEPVGVELDLIDPDVASQQYESVTGAYVVRLRPDLPGLVAGRRLRVEAIYNGADGARFRSSRDLTWPE